MSEIRIGSSVSAQDIKLRVTGETELKLRNGLYLFVGENVTIDTQGVDIIVGDSYKSSYVKFAGSSYLNNVKITAGGDVLLDGVCIIDTTLSGSISVGSGCVIHDSTIKSVRADLNGDRLTIGDNVKVAGSYIKNHVGANTELGDNTNVSAAVGANLVIPPNRAIYKPIASAARRTEVDEDLLEMLDALQDS